MTTATNPTPDQPARTELRDNGLWHVIYSGTVVGRHRAKYRALEQAAALNAELDS